MRKLHTAPLNIEFMRLYDGRRFLLDEQPALGLSHTPYTFIRKQKAYTYSHSSSSKLVHCTVTRSVARARVSQSQSQVSANAKVKPNSRMSVSEDRKSSGRRAKSEERRANEKRSGRGRVTRDTHMHMRMCRRRYLRVAGCGLQVHVACCMLHVAESE